MTLRDQLAQSSKFKEGKTDGDLPKVTGIISGRYGTRTLVPKLPTECSFHHAAGLKDKKTMCLSTRLKSTDWLLVI